MENQSSGYPNLPPEPATTERRHSAPDNNNPIKQDKKEAHTYGTVQCCAFDVGKNQELYHTGDAPVNTLYPLLACAIGSISLYPEWPHCLGYGGTCTCLWLRGRAVWCKPVRADDTSKACWIIEESVTELVPMSTLCQFQMQLFLFDCRLGIPLWHTEYENPCVGSIFGVTYCFNFTGMLRFFDSMGALRRAAEEREAEHSKRIQSGRLEL